MAFFTLSTNGSLFDVLDGSTLTLGLDGAPVATLELPEDAAPELGPADILVAQGDDEPVRFVGTLVFARPHEGRCSVTWVGGAGALGGEAVALHYTTVKQPVQLATVVEALVEAAGEQLTEDALLSLVGLELPRWTRVAGETWGKALSRALGGTGRRWRILDSGLVWIGVESWPEAELGGAQLDEDKDGRVVSIAIDRATLRPGTLLDERQVVRVTFASSGHADAQLDEDAGGARALARLVARHSAVDPYAREYTAEVVRQNADQTLDLRVLVEDVEPWLTLPFEELTSVPFDAGVQGARYVLPAGAHVRVRFLYASPAGALAFGRPTSAGADRGVARLADPTVNGSLSLVGGPGGLAVTYAPPGGLGQTVGVITATAGAVPVTFAGAIMINLAGLISGASQEVYLQ